MSKLKNSFNNQNIPITKENILEVLQKESLEYYNRYNIPISFDLEGNIISFWNDKNWKFLSSKEKNYILNIGDYNDLNENLFNEIKLLTLYIYYIKYKKNYDSKFIRAELTQLYNIIKECNNLEYSSVLELNEDFKLIQVLENIKGRYAFRTLQACLVTLQLANKLNNPNLPLNINFVEKIRKLNKGSLKIKDLAKKYSITKNDYVDQTLYIPNKIQSKLINECIKNIEEKRHNLTNIMNCLEEDYLLYEKAKKDFNINKISIATATMKSNMRRKKLKEVQNLLIKHNISHFQSISEAQKEIKLLATSCSILMLNFSGMRINELCKIKTDGFKVVNSEPKLYILRSYETKISGGQIADYITSPIIKDCIDILKEIHAFAAKYDDSIDPSNLFVTSKHHKLLTYGRADSIGEHINDFAKNLNLVIDMEDLKESELLNGPRDYIKVGEIWPLASHQFRRTLIVNFVSHRLGTINAVKQQVKHMYATMTEYYAKNSQLALTFNLNVVKEIYDNIEEELLNEGVRQYKKFYYSEEPLAGIKGKEIMEKRQNIKVLSDNEIKQLFKSGLYKISKSMYGYCTKGNLCDKKEAIDPTFCGASCSTMIITKENANNWQKLYFRNKKLLENDFNIGGIPMSAAKTTMQSQNEVAKGIMDKFNMKYED